MLVVDGPWSQSVVDGERVGGDGAVGNTSCGKVPGCTSYVVRNLALRRK